MFGSRGRERPLDLNGSSILTPLELREIVSRRSSRRGAVVVQLDGKIPIRGLPNAQEYRYGTLPRAPLNARVGSTRAVGHHLILTHQLLRSWDDRPHANWLSAKAHYGTSRRAPPRAARVPRQVERNAPHLTRILPPQKFWFCKLHTALNRFFVERRIQDAHISTLPACRRARRPSLKKNKGAGACLRLGCRWPSWRSAPSPHAPHSSRSRQARPMSASASMPPSFRRSAFSKACRISLT